MNIIGTVLPKDNGWVPRLEQRVKRMLFFIVVVSVGVIAMAGDASEVCVTHQIRNKATNTLVDHKIRCSRGCCGVYPNQDCCVFSIGVLVGGLVGGMATVSLIVLLVCCCVKKHNNSQASVEPEHTAQYPFPHRPRTPHNTNINVLYAGGGPYAHYNPTFGWMFPVRRPATPISPPPYLDRDTPPPPYSRTHPRVFHHRISEPTLPGCLEDNSRSSPQTPSLLHPHFHPGGASVMSSAAGHGSDHHSSGSESDTDDQLNTSSSAPDTNRSALDGGPTVED